MKQAIIISNLDELAKLSLSKYKIPFREEQIERINIIIAYAIWIWKKKNKTNYLYHNFEHTFEAKKGVLSVTYQLLTYEFEQQNINLDLAELTLVSAIFHDFGYIEKANENEDIGFKYAKKVLGDLYQKKHNLFNELFTEKKLEAIKYIIKSTTVPVHPENVYEQILCDADVNNFGRDDFFEKGEKIRIELKMPENFEWYKNTYKLMERYFFSDSAKKLYQRQKEKNQQIILKKIKEFEEQKLEQIS